MVDHPYGWTSLLPPVVAIALAIATRRVVLSLASGIFVGALVLAKWNPITAVTIALEEHLWQTIIDPFNLRIFLFTLLMGAMISVIHEMGGMRGLINIITPWAKNRKHGQLVTWGSGMLLFFDDYANTIVIGSTLRSLTDRLKISREKLAFIVDSTAAPVAGVAPLSTWVAMEIQYISEGLQNTGLASDQTTGVAFDLFFHSIPYRFYAIWMLVFVGLVAFLMRDFGPMATAEKEFKATGHSPGMLEISQSQINEDKISAKWFNAVLPIGVTMGMIFWLLYTTGLSAWHVKHPGDSPGVDEILSGANSVQALAYGSLAGLVVAITLAWLQRLLTWKQIATATQDGMKNIVPALVILVCAMTLSGMTRGETPKSEATAYSEADSKLYTGVYLSKLLVGSKDLGVSSDQSGEGGAKEKTTVSSMNDTLTVKLFPTIVFVLAGVVAFCTGTSFGTMGILMPMTVSVAYSILSGDALTASGNPILLASIGAVLAGSIFGDHCSPISDTTVLSSQSSACSHLAHVWTQMPYALTVGAVAILFGTLPIGFGVSVWVLLPLGVVAMIAILLLIGNRTDV